MIEIKLNEKEFRIYQLIKKENGIFIIKLYKQSKLDWYIFLEIIMSLKLKEVIEVHIKKNKETGRSSRRVWLK